MTLALWRGTQWLCVRETTFYQPPEYAWAPFQSSQDQIVLAAVLIVAAIGLAIVAVVEWQSIR